MKFQVDRCDGMTGSLVNKFRITDCRINGCVKWFAAFEPTCWQGSIDLYRFAGVSFYESFATQNRSFYWAAVHPWALTRNEGALAPEKRERFEVLTSRKGARKALSADPSSVLLEPRPRFYDFLVFSCLVPSCANYVSFIRLSVYAHIFTLCLLSLHPPPPALPVIYGPAISATSWKYM